MKDTINLLIMKSRRERTQLIYTVLLMLQWGSGNKILLEEILKMLKDNLSNDNPINNLLIDNRIVSVSTWDLYFQNKELIV